MPFVEFKVTLKFAIAVPFFVALASQKFLNEGYSQSTAGHAAFAVVEFQYSLPPVHATGGRVQAPEPAAPHRKILMRCY